MSNMYFDHDVDERITHAYEALDELMALYQVDICVDESGDYFFDVRETPKPELKVV
jgi:hypothetical protein